MKFKACIFDFDYTLADTSEGIVDCMNYAFKKIDLPELSPATIKASIGKNLEQVLIDYQDIRSPELAKTMQNFFAERAAHVMTEKSFIFPQVPDLIQALLNENIKLAIVSTKPADQIEAILKRDNLLQFFPIIIGGDMVKKHKPSPEGLLNCLRKLAVNSKEALYIGDSHIDAETAQAAGLSFAGVLNGQTPQERLETYPNIGVFQNLANLKSYLLQEN